MYTLGKGRAGHPGGEIVSPLQLSFSYCKMLSVFSHLLNMRVFSVLYDELPTDSLDTGWKVNCYVYSDLLYVTIL